MTAVNYIFEQLEEQGLIFLTTKTNEMTISISASDYLDIKRLAKEMEKQQIIDAFDEGQEYEYQYHINNAPKFYSETYFTETYGSKGSDDHIVDTNKMISSQTEISDEEIFYQKQVMNPYSTGEQSYTAYEKGFMDFAKWYREQLKQRQ